MDFNLLEYQKFIDVVSVSSLQNHKRLSLVKFGIVSKKNTYKFSNYVFGKVQFSS